jgi:hypothetical protein
MAASKAAPGAYAHSLIPAPTVSHSSSCDTAACLRRVREGEARLAALTARMTAEQVELSFGWSNLLMRVEASKRNKQPLSERELREQDDYMRCENDEDAALRDEWLDASRDLFPTLTAHPELEDELDGGGDVAADDP